MFVKVCGSGMIVFGYCDVLILFLYLNVCNQLIGYLIELCKVFVLLIEDVINWSLMICWVLVMFDICIDVVVSGKVDLECGFMISNFECQKCVVFLLIIFVVGMKVMVKCGVLICLFCDFVGKKVVVMVGMINEKMLCDLNDKF